MPFQLIAWSGIQEIWHFFTLEPKGSSLIPSLAFSFLFTHKLRKEVAEIDKERRARMCSCQLTQSEERSARFLHPLSHSSSWQYWEGWSHGDGRDQACSNWLVTYLQVSTWATYLSTLRTEVLSRCCVWTAWVCSSNFSLSAIPLNNQKELYAIARPDEWLKIMRLSLMHRSKW